MRENTKSQDKTERQNIKKPPEPRGKKPPKKISAQYLHNAGLAYLQRFPASTAHFRRVMGRKIDRSCNYHKEQDKEACITLLDGAVAGFVRMGLLDDDAYLRGMVTSYRRRGLSKQAIAAKLQQKGMTQSVVIDALSAFDEEGGTEDPELAAALRLARRKKLGPFARSAEADKSKSLAALARAGFAFDTAKKALSMPLEDAETALSEAPL